MSQVLGINPLIIRESTEPYEFSLGTVGVDREGKRYVYCVAGGTIADRVPVKAQNTVAPWASATASGNAGRVDGVNTTGVSIASGQHFWLQVSGIATNVNVADSSTAGSIVAALADSNGDLVIINATSATTGVHLGRGVQLEAESSDVADVNLWVWY